MKFKYIHSDELPNIDSHVKECINSGKWFLFRPQGNHMQASYFLKVDGQVFGLDASGKILPYLEQEEVIMDELFYFDDVPRPISLSNQFAAS